jgi:hypothetical protein
MGQRIVQHDCEEIVMHGFSGDTRILHFSRVRGGPERRGAGNREGETSSARYGRLAA